MTELGAPPSRPKRRALAFVALGLILVTMVIGTGGWLRLLGMVGIGPGNDLVPPALPVVLLMDSPHPARVYDEEVIAAGGTNADVLNDVLRDLPVQRVKETAGPYWHRHEEMRQLRPDLVVIHFSAFCTEVCEDDRVKMRAFLEHLADTDAQFLIYTGSHPARLPGI